MLLSCVPLLIRNVTTCADRSMLTLMCPTGQTIVARQLEDGTLLRNYTRVLEIILRLRQICDAAALCPVPPPDPAEATATVEKATPELLARLAAVLEVTSCSASLRITLGMSTRRLRCISRHLAVKP